MTTHPPPSSDPRSWSDRPTLIDDVEVPTFTRASPGAKNRALLTVLTGPLRGAVYPITKAISSLGRSEEADICIGDPNLSRVHARIVKEGGAYMLIDSGSTNGTFVNDVRVSGAVRVDTGSRVRFGKRTVVSISLHDELEEIAALSIREAALRDRLTGVYNRGVFEDRLKSEFAFAKRHDTTLSLILADVDHFKAFNDTHGHQVGDLVLAAVGKQIVHTVRTEDIVARYGGEEFVIIARATPADRSIILGERLRSAIEELLIPLDDPERTCDGDGDECLRVTASFGIATWEPGSGWSAEQLVEYADRSLYAAKHGGRNQAIHARDLGRSDHEAR